MVWSRSEPQTKIVESGWKYGLGYRIQAWSFWWSFKLRTWCCGSSWSAHLCGQGRSCNPIWAPGQQVFHIRVKMVVVIITLNKQMRGNPFSISNQTDFQHLPQSCRQLLRRVVQHWPKHRCDESNSWQEHCSCQCTGHSATIEFSTTDGLCISYPKEEMYF